MENSNPIPPAGQQDLEEQEEIMIMSSVSEAVKQFLKETMIVWYDPNVNSPENANPLNDLKTLCYVQTFTGWKEASTYLERTQASFCQVITSGDDGEIFVKEICPKKQVSAIHVFCPDNIDKHEAWSKQYSKIKSVNKDFSEIVAKIRQKLEEWQSKSSSQRLDLPSFVPIFDDMNISDINYLHFHLEGLVHFNNRKQAKKDFLALAKALYGPNDIDIAEFENKYDKKEIFYWYTRESFLYKLANNCLRIASPDSIQYCRLVLKDLETAIKDKYEQQSHEFSGLLYRGAYISNDEWTRLKDHVGQEIEMHGFLSATKKESVAIGFISGNKKKAFITIIVPNFRSEKDSQGFADIKEESDNKDEEEVLFNVRSRFTILETATKEIAGETHRHLVLLYGAQTMRRFTKQRNPLITIQINRALETRCHECKQKINFDNASMIAASLYDANEFTCMNCLQKNCVTRLLPLVCISPSNHNLSSSSEDQIILKVKGTVMPSQNQQNIPFYGYKCQICQEMRPKACFKCLDCKDTKMIYCDKCFFIQESNSCSKKAHLIIYEGSAFSFWSEEMSDKELRRLQHYTDELAKKDPNFYQAQIFYYTQNYPKAKEYYHKFLEKNSDSNKVQIATAHHNLGYVSERLGEFPKAIECYSKAVEIWKVEYGGNDPLTAASYHNLGSSYEGLEEYQKAIEYYVIAVKIQEAVIGHEHNDTANSYHSLGSVYHKLGEYHKALEYYTIALKIRKAVFGDTHRESANSYNNIGLVFQNLGEYQKAEEYLLIGLEILNTVYGDKHPVTATVYNNLGVVYHMQGKYQKEVEFLSKGLEITKLVFGDKHKQTATAYNNLGSAYENLGEYKKMKECLSAALEITKAVFGDEFMKTTAAATCYNNLGKACKALGQYKKAVEYCLTALDIHKAVLGDKHPDTATSYDNLGSAYNTLGEYKKALECYSKALGIRKAVLGDKHPDTAQSYSNLASAHDSLGEAQKAETYYFKALRIQKGEEGEKNFGTATTLNNLGSVYEGKREYNKALEQYSASLKIVKELFGGEHHRTAACYNNVGSAYHRLGRHQEAEEYYSKALKIRKEKFGENHVQTADSYHSLGGLQYTLGRYMEAVECFVKALPVQKAVFGNSHPDTLASYNNLASIYYSQGHFQQATEYYSLALEIAKVTFRENHPQIEGFYRNFALACEYMGRFQDAEKNYIKALQIRQAVYGPNHPYTMELLQDLQLCLQSAKRA